MAKIEVVMSNNVSVKYVPDASRCSFGYSGAELNYEGLVELRDTLSAIIEMVNELNMNKEESNG